MDKPAKPSMDRREAVAALLQKRGDLLVIGGLGSSTYDIHAAGDSPENFYLWGAMGGAALVGLGLAQAVPHRAVLVITGDAEMLMGLGGLATIAVAGPANLALAVIDNHHLAETGMQLSHTGGGVDLARVAEGCGFAQVSTAYDLGSVKEFRGSLHSATAGPRFCVIKVKAENPPRSLPPRDGVHLKNRFRAALGYSVS